VRSAKAVCSGTLCSLLAVVFSAPAFAQLTSAPVPVALVALAPESLTVTLTSGATVNFTLTGGSADLGSITPAWTTTWNLKPSRNSVAVCVFLSGALTGTGTNTDTVPMANILGQPDAAGSFTAITGNGCGQTGNALLINTYALTSPASRKNVSKNDSVALEINDSALTLEADTYSGTLNIVAQATP